MRDSTKIEAWNLADELSVAIYQATRAFPREEIYSVTSQIRRAAGSVAAKVVEGSSRESKTSYLSDADAEGLIGQPRETFACLHGLIKAVEREAGKSGKILASIASLLFFGLARWSSSA